MYWKITTKENMLKALLINDADVSAFKYTHLYLENADLDLLLLCVQNTNEYYLKNSLQGSIFGSQLLNSEKFIFEILLKFKIGSKLNLIMKVLGFIDFTKWS